MIEVVRDFDTEIKNIETFINLSKFVDLRKIIEIKKESEFTYEILELLDIKKVKTEVRFKDEEGHIDIDYSSLLAVVKVVNIDLRRNRRIIFRMDLIPILPDGTSSFLATEASNYDGFDFVEK